MEYKDITKIYDITEWDGQEYTTTLGTRMKMVYKRPDGRNYFFKESYKNYPWEFWSEVIASKVGKAIGARVVDYNVAFISNANEGYKAGCICEFVQDNANEELIHGLELLLIVKPEFDKEKGKDHSFQLIEQALMKFSVLKPYIENIIEAIVFDSLIGNRDRHQENWAVIIDIRTFRRFYRFPRLIAKPLIVLTNTLRLFINYVTKGKALDVLGFRFSPLYDNGSSLGREILEESLDDLINSPDHETKLRRYALGKKYQSHIRWNSEHIGHFDLIMRIREKHPILTKRYLLKFVNNFDPQIIEEIVNNIDKGFKPPDKKYCLSNKRKQLIIELLKLRHAELKRVLEFDNANQKDIY